MASIERSLSPDDEGFHDYTVATTLEKLVAAIENGLRHILTKEVPRRSELRSGASAGAPPPLAYSARLHHRLPFRSETWTLSLHLPSHGTLATSEAPAAPAWQLWDQPHKLQEWHGPGPCLVLAPDSYSGRVLEEEEAQTLLSAGIAALSHLRLPYPIFIPVHDALRDAARGAALLPDGRVVHLESDSVHSSSLLEGWSSAAAQLEFLARRLRTHSPAAAAVCSELGQALLGLEDSEGDGIDAASLGQSQAHAGSGGALTSDETASGLRVVCAARRSYQVPVLRCEYGDGEASSAAEVELVTETWDDDAPWRPWAAEDDPLGGLELDALWQHTLPQSAPALRAMEAANHPLLSAARWRLVAVQRDYVPDTGRRSLIVLQATDQRRRFLRLQSILNVPEAMLGVLRPPPGALPCPTSFSGLLEAVAEHAGLVAKARDAAELGSDEWWLQQGSYVPPIPQAHVLQDAIRDLFDAPTLPTWPGIGITSHIVGSGAEDPTPADSSDRLPVGKAAPLGSLATRLALHALRLGNPRATAMLWSRFLRELRFAHWEPLTPVPRMDGKGENSNGQGQVPDLAASLLHQKLQMLELCIQAQRAQRADGRAVRSRPLLGDTFPQSGEDSSEEESSLQRDGATSSASAYHSAGASSVEALDQVASDDQTLSMEGSSNSHTAAQGVSVAWLDRVAAALAGQTLGGAQDGVPPGDDHSTALEPQGVVGQLDATLINDPKRKLNVPATQDAPPCTEDVLIERAAAAQALSCTSQGRSHDGHNGPQGAQGEGINAMPLGTWIRIEGALLLSDMQAFKAANPGCCIEDFVRWHSPKDLIQTSPGGKWELSARMASPDSAWAGLWAAAKPIAADKQRPLFQPALEGERALHFLETLPPAALHAELLGLGFAAAIVFLERAPAARLPSVKAQIERLRRIGEAWLGDGGVAALFPAPVDASEGEDFSDVSAPAASTSTLHDLLAKGLSMQSTQALITALGCVEQTVAAAQSILNRLGCVWDEPEARSLATAPQKMSGDSDVPSLADSRVAAGKNEVKELAERVANALVAAALGQPCTESGSSEGAGPQDYGTFVELSPQEIACLAAAVIKVSGAGDDSGGGPIGAGGKSGAWEPMPFASEWCVEVSSAGNITASKTGEGSFGASVGHPLHRLFVRRLPAELRVATAITGEL